MTTPAPSRCCPCPPPGTAAGFMLCDTQADGTVVQFVRIFMDDGSYLDRTIAGEEYTPTGTVAECTGDQLDGCDTTTPITAANMCLADGTPIVVVVQRDCDGTVTAPGWVNLATGVYTAGLVPAGTAPCDASVATAGSAGRVALCDLQTDGTMVGFLRAIAADGTVSDTTIDGLPYTPTGDVQMCDTVAPCASPTTPVTTVGLCLADSTPIAVVMERDCAGLVTRTGWVDLTTGTWSAGAPPAGTRACGEDSAFEVSGVLCDIDATTGDVLGLVLIEVERGTDGEISGIRLINAADGTEYTLQGTLSVCPAGIQQPEKDLAVLCDVAADGTVTAFVRDYARDENGAIVGHTDYTLTGAAYTPTGTIGACETSRTPVCYTSPTVTDLCTPGALTVSPIDTDITASSVEANPNGFVVTNLSASHDGSTSSNTTITLDAATGVATGLVLRYDFAGPADIAALNLWNQYGADHGDNDGIGSATVTVYDTNDTQLWQGPLVAGNGGAPFNTSFGQILEGAAYFTLSTIARIATTTLATIGWREIAAVGAYRAAIAWECPDETITATITGAAAGVTFVDGDLTQTNGPHAFTFASSLGAFEAQLVSSIPGDWSTLTVSDSDPETVLTGDSVSTLAVAVAEPRAVRAGWFDEAGAVTDANTGESVGDAQIVPCATANPPCTQQTTVVRLCDLNPDTMPNSDGQRCAVPFLRSFGRDCDGAVVSTNDTELDGTTPYTPAQVVDCDGAPSLAELEWPQTGIIGNNDGGTDFTFTLTNPQTAEVANIAFNTVTPAGGSCGVAPAGTPPAVNAPNGNPSPASRFTYTLDAAAQQMTQFRVLFVDLDPFEGVRNMTPTPDGVYFLSGSGTWNGIGNIDAAESNSTAVAYWNTIPTSITHTYRNQGGGVACHAPSFQGVTLVPGPPCNNAAGCEHCTELVLCDDGGLGGEATISGLPATGTLTNGVTWSVEGSPGRPWPARETNGDGSWWGIASFPNPTIGPATYTFDYPVDVVFSVALRYVPGVNQTSFQVPVGSELVSLPGGYHYDESTGVVSGDETLTECTTITDPTKAASARFRLRRVTTFALEFLGVRAATCGQFGNFAFGGIEVAPAGASFIRTVCRGCDGQVIGTPVDTAMDGVTPYIPLGMVGDCGAAATTVGCDCTPEAICIEQDPVQVREFVSNEAHLQNNSVDPVWEWTPQSNGLPLTDPDFGPAPAATWYDMYRPGFIPADRWSIEDTDTDRPAFWITPHPDSAAIQADPPLPGEGPSLAADTDWFGRAYFDLPANADPGSIQVQVTVLNADQYARSFRLNDGPWQTIGLVDDLGNQGGCFEAGPPENCEPYTFPAQTVDGAQAGRNTLYMRVFETVGGYAGVMAHMIVTYQVSPPARRAWTRMQCCDGSFYYLDETGQRHDTLPTGWVVTPCGSGGSAPVLVCDDNGPFLRHVTYLSDGSVSVSDTSIDGSEYTPIGTVGQCPPRVAPCGTTSQAMVLCDTEQPTAPVVSDVDFATLEGPYPDSVTLANGVTVGVDQGTYLPMQPVPPGSLALGASGVDPQVWTFSEPSTVRFRVSPSTISGDTCIQLPPGAVVENVQPGVTHNAGTNQLCQSGAITTDIGTTVRVDNTTGFQIGAVSGSDPGNNDWFFRFMEVTSAGGAGGTTQFLRHLTTDCAGTVVATSDTMLDGTTPYTPGGVVSMCQGAGA